MLNESYTHNYHFRSVNGIKKYCLQRGADKDNLELMCSSNQGTIAFFVNYEGKLCKHTIYFLGSCSVNTTHVDNFLNNVYFPALDKVNNEGDIEL